MNMEMIRNECSLGGICGGCFYAENRQEKYTYAGQLSLKEQRVRGLLDKACGENAYGYEGTVESPLLFGYRNKMEYSFGDAEKDGPLTLGLHKKRSFYDVIDVDCCKLVHEDCNRIVAAAGKYFRELKLTYNDKRTHLGYLRHLLIRRTVNTGEILIDLVTTSQPLIPVEKHADINEVAIYTPESFAGGANALKEEPEPVKRKRGRRGSGIEIIPGQVRAASGTAMLNEEEVISGFVQCLKALQENGMLEGSIRGILHTYNDSLSDAVKNDRTDLIYGEDHITEDLLGLKFKISPFSFFQTNTKGAEVLYSKVREFIGEELGPDMRVFDLYSGTGTIAQMLAPCAKEVIGVEIVEEAVEAAKANAAANGLTNCRFVADDVLHALDTLDSPDLIVLDPPRDGVNAKALMKIINYGVKNMVYVSCKPESLARDLEMLQYAGYRVVRSTAVDQFPWTDNIETIVLLSQQKAKDYIETKVELGKDDITSSELEATYRELHDYVLEVYGLNVSNLYIYQVKRKCGLEVNQANNYVEDCCRPNCPKDKEIAIVAALRHFGMIKNT